MNNEEIWQELPETEKENYFEFHQDSYIEDLKHSEKNLIEFPRWSIISGYPEKFALQISGTQEMQSISSCYAMHDITKLFLAKQYNIKIPSPKIHYKTIKAIEELIKDEELKKKILRYLKEAKNTFYNVERLKEKVVPLLLKRGKEERSTSQYYTEDYSKISKINSEKAVYFLDNIVKPYIQIIKELMR